MPLHHAIAIFILSLALVGVAVSQVEQLRAKLTRPAVWLGMLAIGGIMSAVTAFVAATRHSGTGFTTSHGWPKPYYFIYLSEAGVRSSELSVLYFLGNSLVFVGTLLVLWTAWKLIRG